MEVNMEEQNNKVLMSNGDKMKYEFHAGII